MVKKANNTIITKILKVSVNIEPEEIKATLLSFLFIVILMMAYYILRPVRDAMSSDWTDAQVSWLWTINFFISTASVACYGYAVSRISFRLLIPSVYGFFSTTFVIFYFSALIINDRTIIDKIFYVWVSVFSLFHISVFWSFMAELFKKEQASRLFGFIAVGASVGGIIGPAIPSFFSESLGTDTLMLVASTLLVVSIPIIFYLQTTTIAEPHHSIKCTTNVTAVNFTASNLTVPNLTTPNLTIGGKPFSGFTLFFTNRYLLAIGAFLFLYTCISSFVYFELKNILADFNRIERTIIWAQMDLAVNTLAIVTGIFATGRLVKGFGMTTTITLIPVVISAGLLIVAASPVVIVVVILQIVRRAGNYAITRPSREMLFTRIDRETRFKAKPVIDIVVYRGGDSIMAWLFTGLTQGLGLGLAAVAIVGAAIAAVWAIIGVYLGLRYDRDD